MKKILVMNGPNLDMLGVREPSVYGHETLSDLERLVKSHGASRGLEVACFQSNSEGALVDKIHEAHAAFDGIVYNPGAHTHYSYALRDALGGIDVPCVEVHISDVDAREPFRRVSVIAPACVAQVKGRGFSGYCDAIDLLVEGARTRLGEGYERRCRSGQVIVGGASGEGDEQDAGELDSIDSAKPEFGETLLEESEPACPRGTSAQRLDRLRKSCFDAGMGAFLVRDTSSIRWLTAFDDVFDDEEAHVLLTTPHAAVLHTDARYSAAAAAAARAEHVVEVNGKRMTHAAFAVDMLEENAPAAAAINLSSAAPLVLGIEDAMPLSQFRSLEAACAPVAERLVLRETAGLIVGLRAVKDPFEIARMRRAQAITDRAFSHIVAFMQTGMTERDVQIELEDFMRRHGASDVAFSSIVATGAHGASPHAVPGDTRLEAGQCVVLDFGARAHGYCSDMTRMVFLGEPSARMREAYEVLRMANEQVEGLLKPGVTGKEAHERAEEILASGGFAGKMGHGLGHGVGIDIHEEPVLSPRNEAPLVAGNVVTVEPGIYLPGEFGMRLEDCGVVTDDGFAVFTQSTHDMVVR